MRWLYAAVCALLLGLRAPGRHALVPDSDLVPAPEQVSVSDLVPAPEQVSVQCSDHRPRVSWSCPQCKSNYTVKITGTETRTWNTSQMDQDLGEFVWGQNQMLDFMFVEVTATRDRTSPDRSSPDRSSPSQSKSFSYSRLKTVDIRCGLLLPPPTLSVDGSEVTLKMDNPLFYYTELDTMKDSKFTYTINIPESEQDQPCVGPVCVAVLKLVEASHGVCVNVSGTINRGSEEILLQSESVCAAPSGQDSSLWAVAILVVLIFVSIIVVVTTLICKTRAWVFPKIPSPKTLIPDPRRRLFTPVSPTVYSQVQVLSPKNPDPDLDLDTDPESPSLGSEHGLIQEDRKFQKGYSRGLLEEQDQDDSSDSTETGSLPSTASEEEQQQEQQQEQEEQQQEEQQQEQQEQQEQEEQQQEEQHSNYERRPEIVQINMGGDVVIGYRG